MTNKTRRGQLFSLDLLIAAAVLAFSIGAVLQLQESAQKNFAGANAADGNMAEVIVDALTSNLQPAGGAGGVSPPPVNGADQVGYWKFDNSSAYGESESVAYDYSGHGNTGTLMGGATYAEGVFGKALSLDGANDWASVGLNAPSGAYTLEMWAKYEGAWGTDYYTTLLEFGNDAPCFGTVGTDLPTLEMYGVIFGGVVLNNAWAHLIYTRDGATSKLYINGSEVASNSGIPPTGGVGMGIGYHAGDGYWRGLIDNVIIYNRALSPTEVSEHYNLGLGGGGGGGSGAPIPEQFSFPPYCVSYSNGTSGCAGFSCPGNVFAARRITNCASGACALEVRTCG
jgi:hypothetical protein